MKVVIASSNQGKILELQTRFTDWELIPQSHYGIQEVEETGITFLENALQKARTIAAHTAMPALADDSGLVIPALQGSPGIYSARFAGVKAKASQNIQKLLDMMSDLPDDKRHGFFYSVLVFLKSANDPIPLVSEGFWHGVILKEPRGNNGFGYDPIFFDLNEQKSAAELSSKLKNKISHRGKAITSLIEKWYASTHNKEPHQSLS